MKFHKKYLGITLCVILLIIIAFLPYQVIFSKAEEVNSISSEMMQENTIQENIVDTESKENATDNVVKENVQETDNNEKTTNEISVENTSLENKSENTITNTVTNTVTNTISNTTNNTVNNSNEIKIENTMENKIQKDIVSSSKPNLSATTSMQSQVSLTNTEVETVSEEYSLTSTLWDTLQYSSGTGTTLTEDGAEIIGWESEVNKYLQIDPTVPADGNTYFITVALPEEFYIVGSDLATPAGYQSVEFTKNEDIKINDTTNLALNTYSGTAVYTLNNMGVSGTIQIELCYDVRLWDKVTGSSITADGVNPVVVTLSKKDTSGTVTELKRLYIKKVTAGTGITDAIGMNGKIEGETNSSTTLTVPKDKKVTVIKSINNNSGAARYKYFPSMTVTINLPYYTASDGTKYYLPFNEDSISVKKIQYTSYTVDTSAATTNGIIKINFVNPYWNTGDFILFDLGPLTDEMLALNVSEFAFRGGRITAVVNSKNGTTGIQYSTVGILNINYQKESLENVVLTSGNPSVTILERPDEAISLLGGFYLENKGTGDSSAKTINITFDIDNTNRIKVTTVNIFADTVQEYMDVKYTLVDENGTNVYLDENGNRVSEGTDGAVSEWTYTLKNSFYNSTTKTNLKNKLTRQMLPEAHKSYYFKTINYKLESILSQTMLFAKSANSNLNGAGNFLGYVDDVNTTDRQTATSSIRIISENTSISDLTRTAITTLRTTSNPSYIINDFLKMNKTNIQAGESVTLSGTFSGVEYPYGNSTWIKGITIAALLPKDVSINEQSVILKDAKGVQITGYTISTQDVGDGKLLWKIKLPADICIGMATENITSLPAGMNISFSMQLDTSYTMNAATLYAKDIILATGYKQENSAGGSYAWTSRVDTYDLNENGSTTDKIAGARSSTTASCQVVSQTATLDIENSISIEREGSATAEGLTGSLLSEDDVVNYNLDIGCFSGGRAEGFAYYIPIPKTTSITDNFLIDNSENGKFDFALKDVPSLSGSDIFDITYAFETNLTYETAQTFDNWYTAEEIETDANLNLEDVTMIKLTVKEEGIQNGDKTRITVKMMYSGANYLSEAGMKNVWHSGGYYKHINSGRESAGNFSTESISVDIGMTMETTDLEEIVLTAAKGMLPQTPGNTNRVIVEKENFPIFKNSHTFSITEVETYNVTLQTKEYIEANTDMAGIDANRTFAITIQMPDGTEKDILSTASTNPIEIGTSALNDSPEFTFKLYNADAITDNSQTRYIVVTLTSNNGVKIKQKININREIAQASDPKMAIVAGKRYLTFDDTTTAVTISQDSAFTTQFIVEYIPDTYSKQTINFSNKLLSGTNVILINLTDTNNPTYWYYKVGLLGTTTLDLTDFISMGKTGSEKYSLPTGIDLIEEKLLLLVDFSECSNFLAEGNYTANMKLAGNTGVDDFITSDLTFTTKVKSTYVLNDIENVVAGEEFKIGYSINLTTGADSKYEGRKLALVLTAPDNIPADTSLTVKNTTYYLNSENQYIISLGDIENPSEDISLKLFSNTFGINEEEYEFDVALWISATANAEAPKLGEIIGSKTFTVTSNGKLKPSLKVKKMSQRIIHKEELGQAITLTYEYISATNCSVTVELQQKIGTAYQKVTDRLNQVNNTTEHNIGVFDITATDGDNKIEFKLSSATPNSTYRLVFKVRDESGTQLLEIPYNFIVIE